MPLVFGKSLYLHTLFFTVISLKTYRIDMSKILIIDDEVQIRTLLTRMMELEGYDVCQAGDCRAALKQLELQNPDKPGQELMGRYIAKEIRNHFF